MKNRQRRTPSPTLLLLTVLLALQARLRSGRDERGDVPGWVMVTVMTATLVIAIGKVAEDELTALLRNAISKVTS